LISSGAERGLGLGSNWGSFNLGGRRFSPLEKLPSPLDDPHGRHRSVLCRDFDLNGLTDILLLNYHSSDRLLLATPDRGFLDRTADAGLSDLDAMNGTLTHLNEDPYLDLVTVRLAKGCPEIRFGTRSGEFVPSSDTSALRWISHATVVDAGDIDNDGDNDLYVSQGCFASDSVEVEDSAIYFTLQGFGNGTPKGFRVPLAGIDSVDLDLRVQGTLERRFVGSSAARLFSERYRWTKAQLMRMGSRPRIAPGKYGTYVYVDDQQRFTVEFLPNPATDSDTSGICVVQGLKKEAVEQFGPIFSALPTLENRLLINDGSGHFRDETEERGVGDPRSTRQSVIADFNNDGNLDIFVLNDAPLLRDEPDAIYWNDGTGHFTCADSPLPVMPIGHGIPTSVLAFDYDDDGDLDLFITNGGSSPPFLQGPYQLLENQSAGGHWLMVRLVGKRSNLFGLGSQVFADLPDGRTLMREVNGGNALFSQSLLPTHFGLGTSTEVARLRVRWPDGHEQTIMHVAADRSITIEEEISPASATPSSPGVLLYVVVWTVLGAMLTWTLRRWPPGRSSP
jgi:hypothetical protein